MYSPFHGGVLALGAGAGFSAALTRSGALYTWGATRDGRLGLGDDGSSTSGSVLARRLRLLRARVGVQSLSAAATREEMLRITSATRPA
jgi:alpha-tubulin suppressor-like RCC1 family protein